jgi:hypothetical protein
VLAAIDAHYVLKKPHTANDRLHQGHQPLREVRVGKAVPGLAHRAGADVARSAR